VNFTGLCILDWNGTLQDDLHHIYECGVQRIFRTFGLPCPTVDEFRDEVTADFMASFYWPRGISKDVTADDLNAIMREGFKEKGAPPDLFPDALSLIDGLRVRGYEMMVVSGYASDKLRDAIARNGLAGAFTRVVGDVRDKPAAFAGCIAACAASGPLVAVGDTIEDAEAAVAVSAQGYICTRGFHSRQRLEGALKDAPNLAFVETLADIVPLLP
jgi:phosphoglycolate phosphatase-like HAD superfamily hydrolase